MKAFLTLLTLAVISAAVFALGSFRQGTGDKPILHVANEVALTVNVARPEKGEIIRLVQAPGDVEPVLEVDIRSEIMAKIEEMPITEGVYQMLYEQKSPRDLELELMERPLKGE